MTRLRRALGRFAVAWLLCQSATLAILPAAVWASAEDPLECTCAHGNHTICPMHHKPAPGSRQCQMRSTHHGDPALLSSLFSAIGLVPPSAPATVSERGSLVVHPDATGVILRPAAPDPPPPRA